MKLIILAIASLFILGAAPAPAPIGEKEIEAAVKAWIKAPSRETEAARAIRQQGIIDGMVGQQLLFPGKLGKETVNKKGGVDIEVVDDSAIRTIVVCKTKDATTGVKVGGKITVGGEIVKVTIKTNLSTLNGKGETVYLPPRIDIFVK